jgi:type VI secretion system protein ImpJ
MSQRDKVVWYEGMHLDPHHFQQWDRFQKFLLNFRMRSLTPYDWGLIDLAVDKEALVNGQFSILRCKGVTPDGLVFNIPDEDPAPAAKNFKGTFLPTLTELAVFLAVPAEKQSGGNIRWENEPGRRDTRFTFQTVRVTDDNTGTDERDIGVGKKNFEIRFGSESLEELSVLKIAEITRAQDGSFALSGTFIPPCLSIGASENLMAITRRLLELLIAKSTALSSKKAMPGDSDWTPQDLPFLLALQSINASIPVLNHFYAGSKGHPEELYVSLSALAGQLSGLSSQADFEPRTFPAYDHDNPVGCFARMDLIIRAILESLVPQAKYLTIPLEKKSESLYVGRVKDAGLFHKAKFFLIAGGDFPEKKLIDEVPTNLRIASPDTINAVLSGFLKALPLKYVASLPAGLPKKEKTLYFQLEPIGPFWEAIGRSQALAIFIPNELSGLKIEVVAV